MKSRNRQHLMEVAEIIDTFRVFPRLFLLVYLFWIIRLTDWMVRWFMRLPAAERTVIVTTFVSIVTTGIFGLFIWIYKVYSDNGRDWTMSPVIPPVTVQPTLPKAPVLQSASGA